MRNALYSPLKLRGLLWPRQAGTAVFTVYYPNAIVTGLYSNAIVANAIYAVPFYSGRGGALDRIALEVAVAAAAGKRARLGIYDYTSDVNIYPNNLVVDAGEVAVDAVAVVEAVINQPLAPDSMYWFVVTSDGTPSTRAAFPVSDFLGSGNGGPLLRGYIIVGSAYGALPNPFPAGGTPSAALYPPIISVRYSA
jgi:hypothetical protein